MLLRALAALALLTTPLVAQVTDDEVRAAWKKLSREDQSEIVEWFSAECERLPTFQVGLMNYVFRELPQSRYDWPEAAQKLPLYDAQRHAPGQPIVRKWLKEDSRTVTKWKERVFAVAPARRLTSAWQYNYATGSVERLPGHADPERIFENGLAGCPVNLDLAEAVLERMLDDGSLRKEHAAFGHAYADRLGKAYPGVTLYDTWCSGAEQEMPDVECLGMVHDIFDDWDTWEAPVPESQHDPLYARLGEVFVKLRRQRGLRTALTRAYFSATPVMRDAYGPSTDRLHSLWDQHGSVPGKLLESLPADDDWNEWWEVKGKELDNQLELYQAGQVRRQTLVADADRVRRLLIGVMTEYGAFGG